MDKWLLVAIVISMTWAAQAVEMKDGSFPVGTDYQKEKDRQGTDPENYKKVYHRVIPGGAEHAEVSASNGPGSNSWSQTYSKHQSFGSADTVQSQSYSSTNGKPGAAGASQNSEAAQMNSKAISDKIKNDIAKAQKDAMARHNEIMSSIQQSMGMGGLGGGMGMGGLGMGMPQFGLQPKTYYQYPMSSDSSFNEFMKSHMRVMREMWQLQNQQIQALQQLIQDHQKFPETMDANYAKLQIEKSRRRVQDSEAGVRVVDGDAVVVGTSR